MKRGLLILACLLVPHLAHAQTVTQTLNWNQAEAPAVVQTWQSVLKVGATVTAVTPTCKAVGTGSVCFVPIVPRAPSGTVVVLTESNGGDSATGSATVPQGPNGPTNITITISITVP